MICEAKGCKKDAHAKSYCTTHYMRLRKHGDAEYVWVRPRGPLVCKVKGCASKVIAYGHCASHRRLLLLYGDPLARRQAPNGAALLFLQQTMAKVRAKKIKACIEWPYAISRDGYGRAPYKGKVWQAHRLMLSAFTKQHCPEKDAAHRCGNPSCINPHHLYWATSLENSLDKIFHGTSNRRITLKQALRITRDTRTTSELAERYQVSKRIIRHIKERGQLYQ